MLALLPALFWGVRMGAQDDEGGSEEGMDVGVSADEQALIDHSMPLNSFVEINPGTDAAAICSGLQISPQGAQPRNQPPPRCIAALGSPWLALAPGDYRLGWPGGLPDALRGSYESIDLTLRVTRSAEGEAAADDGALSVDILSDRSRRRDPDAEACVKVVDEKTGVSLSGLGVRVIQRYRVAGEGLTDERGKFCAGKLRPGPIVAAVNGGNEYLDRSARGAAGSHETTEIRLEGLRGLECRVEDPGGLRHRQPDAHFFFRPVEAPRSTRLVPGPEIAWQAGAEETRDGVRFSIFDSHLQSGPDNPKQQVFIHYGLQNEFVIRFPFAPSDIDKTCKLKLPVPDEREYRIALSCPAGRYLAPGGPLLLVNSGKTPGGEYEAMRMASVSKTEVSRAALLPVRFVSTDAPALRWIGPGTGAACKRDPIPFVPDENGRMKLDLGDCCVSREQAVAMESGWRERENAPAQQRRPPPDNPDPPAETCLERAPLTLQEKAAPTGDKPLNCEQIDELLQAESEETVLEERD
jgi:hypothetical protein